MNWTDIIKLIFIALLLFIVYKAGESRGKKLKHSWYLVYQCYHRYTLEDGTLIIGCFVKIIKSKSKEEAIGQFVEITKDAQVKKRLEIECYHLNEIE